MENEFRFRAQQYLWSLDPEAEVAKKLGAGQEGFVWESTRGSALKVFEREQNYNRELKCYLILEGFHISQIDGFYVPQLLGYSDELLVIEMTVVSAPYILDFGKAYFSKPEYPSDAAEEYFRRCEEDFGDYWPTVLLAIYELEQLGIWYVDANTRNINCSGLPPPD